MCIIQETERTHQACDKPVRCIGWALFTTLSTSIPSILPLAMKFCLPHRRRTSNLPFLITRYGDLLTGPPGRISGHAPLLSDPSWLLETYLLNPGIRSRRTFPWKEVSLLDWESWSRRGRMRSLRGWKYVDVTYGRIFSHMSTIST